MFININTARDEYFYCFTSFVKFQRRRKKYHHDRLVLCSILFQHAGQIGSLLNSISEERPHWHHAAQIGSLLYSISEECPYSTTPDGLVLCPTLFEPRRTGCCLLFSTLRQGELAKNRLHTTVPSRKTYNTIFYPPNSFLSSIAVQRKRKKTKIFCYTFFFLTNF